MGRKGNGNMEASKQGSKEIEIWNMEISLTGNVGRIERFRGYVKVNPPEGQGWIWRIPPSKAIIRPYKKEQARELLKVYKEIEKEKLGKILQQNWKILEDMIGITEIKGRKNRKNKGNKDKRIRELQEKMKKLQEELNKLEEEEE